MSDIFLSAGLAVDTNLLSRELRFTEYTRVETGVGGGMTWAVGRVDDWDLWGPAWDPVSQTRVLLGGRIALEELEWAAAERLPYQGGLAARHLLSRWLEGGAKGVADYNGAAVVVILDERQREARIWTDRMGFYPAFAYTDDDGLIIASHPDVIARTRAAAGRPLSIDQVTIAEFLRTGSSVHPHTYWTSVSQLNAATQFFIAETGRAWQLHRRTQYWRPAYLDAVPAVSRAEFVDHFADALRAAGRRRTLARFGRIVVLLSAGADSRGVLCAAGAPSHVHCYTYFDEPNGEYFGAQKIAALAGAQHFGIERARDHYVRHASESARLSGGMWSIESGHHAGLVQTIRDRSQPGTVLTGCYCDYLFKGLALNREHVRIAGRALPLYRRTAYAHEFYLEHSRIAPGWHAKVEARLDSAFPPELRASDPRRLEHVRLCPISREGDASSRLTAWRLLPFDLIVADNDILDVYGRLSVADKISGIAFGQAIAEVAGAKIAAVPNNNFGAPVGVSEAGRVAAFLLASGTRKLRRFAGYRKPDNPRSVATDGSWPNLTRVALNSPLMRQWFEEIPARHGEALLDYLHPASRAWGFDEFAIRDTFLLYRLITADLWLRQVAQPTPIPAQASVP